jgi:4-hydroxy-tetrahydrodipicolinate synthase
MYNNPTTSVVDMSPEPSARMFETLDNLTIIKVPTAAPFRMRRIDQLSGGRLPF